MLYYYNKEEMLSTGSIAKKILVIYYNGEKSFTTQQILSDINLFNEVKTKYNAKVAVFDAVPVITVEPTTDVSAIDSFWVAIGKDFTESFNPQVAANWISKLSTKVDIQTLKILIPGIAAQSLWEHTGELDASITFGPSDIDMSVMQETTAYFNSRIKSNTQVFKSISDSENVTKYQADPSDDLFIEIPEAFTLQNCDNPLELIPDRSMVFKPYTNPAYATKRYKELGTISNGDLAKIEGQISNNSFDLYENEKKYYAALTEWVDFNINTAFPSGDGSVLDNTSLSYLEALIAEIYCWNWSHVSTVPDEISAVRDPENPEDVEYEYEFIHTDKASFNSITLLQGFINEVYVATKDPHVYVNAIIQLARWGSRKPTDIVFEGYETKFDLGAGMCTSHVDLSTYKLKIYEDGSDNDFVGFVTDDLTYRDTSINGSKSWSVPLGFVTCRVYESADGIAPAQTRYDVHSFMEAIPLIKSGKLKVQGVYYKEGVWNFGVDLINSFTVSEIARILTDAKLKSEFAIHRCQETEDKCINLQIPSSGIITNEVTPFFEVATYTNLREIINSFNVTDAASFRTFIMKFRCSASATMSVFVLTKLLHLLEVLESDNADTSVSAFERWDNALNAKTAPSATVSEVNAFSDDKTVSTEPQQTVSEPVIQQPVTPQVAPTMQAESAPQTEQPSFVKPVVGNTSWAQVVPDNAIVYPVVNADGGVVCYTAIAKKQQPKNPSKPYKQFLLLSKPGNRTVDEEHKISINAIAARILHTLYLEKVSASMLRQVYIGDSEVLIVLRDYFNSLG